MQELRNISLFENFDDDKLKRLMQISHIRNFEKDQIIFFEGEEAKNLLIILSGKTCVYKTKENANEIILSVFYDGELFAEAPCINHFAYPASAKCLQNSKILLINFEKFKSIFLSDTDISMQIIAALSKKVKQLSRFISDVDKTASQKLAEYLQCHNIDEIKRKDLAAKLNIRPETLSRMLSRLKRDA